MQLSTLRETPLIQLATEGRRRTPWWLSYIVALAVIIGVMSAVTAALQAVLGYKDGSAVGQVVEGIAFAAQILVIFLWVKLFDGRGFTSLGLRGRGIGRMLLGLLIGIGMMVVTVGISVLLGGYSFNASPDHGDLGVTAIVIAILLILAVAVQATGEEIIFRGFVLQSNALGLPGVVAVILPAVVFTVLHMTEGFVPVAAYTIMAYALFAALIALREGSLWLIAGIHIGWNWAQGNLLGAPVSGLAPREATVFTITPGAGASEMLTGGTFGPEASAVAAVVLTIALVVAFMYFRSPAKAAAGE